MSAGSGLRGRALDLTEDWRICEHTAHCCVNSACTNACCSLLGVPEGDVGDKEQAQLAVQVCLRQCREPRVQVKLLEGLLVPLPCLHFALDLIL